MKVIDRAPHALLTDAYELVLSIVLAATSVPILLGHIRPNSITAALDPAFRTGWAVTLLLGALLTVVGLFWPRRPRLEWLGQLLVGLDLVVYGIAALKVGAQQAGLAAAIFAGLGALALWRALKISWQDYIRARLARDAAQALVNQAHRDAGTHA